VCDAYAAGGARRMDVCDNAKPPLMLAELGMKSHSNDKGAYKELCNAASKASYKQSDALLSTLLENLITKL
jgi:hypothetical protein